MPILRGCCCLDLKTGSKIIGVVTLILEILGFISTALALIFLVIFEDLLHETLEKQRSQAAAADSKNTFSLDRDGLSRPNFDYGLNSPEIHHDDVEWIYSSIIENFYLIKIVFLVILGLQFLDVVVSSCLIHGIRKNRRGLMMPFIVMHSLFVLIEFAVLILLIVAYAYVQALHAAFIGVIIVELIFLGVHIYLLLVVISDFQALGLILMHPNDEICLK